MICHKIVNKSLMKKWSQKTRRGRVVEVYNISSDKYTSKDIKEAFTEIDHYSPEVERLLSDKVEIVIGDFSKKIYNTFEKGKVETYTFSEIQKVKKALAIMNLRNPELHIKEGYDLNITMKALIEELDIPDFIDKPKFCVLKNSTPVDFILPASFTIGVLPTTSYVNQFYPLSPRYGILLSEDEKYNDIPEPVCLLEIKQKDQIVEMNATLIEIETQKGFYKEVIGDRNTLDKSVAYWKKHIKK